MRWKELYLEATMRTLLGAALCAFILAFSTVAASAQRKEEVDLLLVLAADVSGSVDPDEFALQRRGHAEALLHPRVQKAITSGMLGKIAVTYIEWSGDYQQTVIVDWTIIDGLASAQHFGAQMVEVERPRGRSTAIGAAIDFSVKRLEAAPYHAHRRTIDISADGTDTSSNVEGARDEAVAKGVTINVLAILSLVPSPRFPWHTHPVGGLENYFRNNVIGGPGSFVVVAEEHRSFGEAIVKKLIAEIAMR